MMLFRFFGLIGLLSIQCFHIPHSASRLCGAQIKGNTRSPLRSVPMGRRYTVQQVEITTTKIPNKVNTITNEMTIPVVTAVTKVSAWLNVLCEVFLCTSAGLTFNLARVTKPTGAMAVNLGEMLAAIGAACALINTVASLRTAFLRHRSMSTSTVISLERQLDRTKVISIVGMMFTLCGAFMASGSILTQIDVCALIDKLPLFPTGLLQPKRIPGMVADSVPVTSMYLLDTAVAVMLVHLLSLITASRMFEWD